MILLVLIRLEPVSFQKVDVMFLIGRYVITICRGKVIFSQVCVKNSVHGGKCTPPRQTPASWADIPVSRHPLGVHHLSRYHPLG